MDNFVTRRARPQIFAIKPYVPGKPIDEVKRELGINDVIKMASNENPLGPSPLAVQAIRQMLDCLHLYPDGYCFDLKSKLAAKFELNKDNFIIGNGSDELIKMISETFLNQGDEVIYAEPSFAEYEFAALVMGAKGVPVPLKNFVHDLDAILAAITPRTKMIYLCNPNNPTGTIVNDAEVERFMQKLPEDILVIFDEAYYEYVQNPDYESGLKYVKSGKNAIVLRTFSKIYGLAALRIGYGITTPELAAAIARVKEPFNVNSMAQIGALAALEDSPHVQNSLEVNNNGKKYLYEQFEQMGIKYVPTNTNFIFLNVGRDCREVFNALLKEGVIVRTGDIFGYPECIRLTIGTAEENERFIQSLKKVLEA